MELVVNPKKINIPIKAILIIAGYLFIKEVLITPIKASKKVSVNKTIQK